MGSGASGRSKEVLAGSGKTGGRPGSSGSGSRFTRAGLSCWMRRAPFVGGASPGGGGGGMREGGGGAAEVGGGGTTARGGNAISSGGGGAAEGGGAGRA